MTPTFQSDDVLLARAIQGDAEAFGDLYQRYMRRIYRYLYYRVGEQGEAEDMTETVFLKVWESLPRFKVGKASFKTWLYRVAHNLVIDHYRTRKVTQPLESNLDLTDQGLGPEQVVMRKEAGEWIANAIAELPPDYQQILVLRFIEDLSHAEAAAVMGRSVAAVRVLQHRALKALAAMVRNQPGIRDD